jgi:hypothetical protein
LGYEATSIWLFIYFGLRGDLAEERSTGSVVL